MSKALVFSGQGSQYVGMMADHYENNEIAKKRLDEANDILGYDIKSIMFEGPKEKLTETRYTQPALFLHSSILVDILKDKIDFSSVAGHSVGEYAALYAAGIIGFKDALETVSLRGNLMFNAGEEKPGTMFAVIGMDDDKVIELCNEFNSNENVVVAANFNSPGQVVISGSRDWLREVSPKFKDEGARMVKELNVSGAFHSPLLQTAQDELESKIKAIDFKTPLVPIYTNVSAKAETQEKDIQNLLINQLTSPVKWTQTLENMNNDGINSFTEIGPGKVLQGLVKRTLGEVEISGYDKSEDLA